MINQFVPCEKCSKRACFKPGYPYTQDGTAVFECECHKLWREINLSSLRDAKNERSR